jgi:replication-associated recombination protein RarA
VTKRPEFTFSGERPDQVVSALRKAIRRGEVDNVVHWVVELILSGEEWWAWRQLAIATSEECGPAWPEGPATIEALYGMWRMTSDPLHAVDATIRLCRAPKSRIADDALAAHLMGHQREMARPIPDEALDVHTVAGRFKLGRTEDSEAGQQHWWDEAGRIENEAPDELADHYKALVRRWWAERRSYPEARKPKEHQKPPPKDYALPLGTVHEGDTVRIPASEPEQVRGS